MVDHHHIYSHQEFDRWANRQDIEPGEAFLLDHALRPELRTLEAGCGGGRIMRGMVERGFGDLHGFDYVAGLIDAARARDPEGRIDFQVQDARSLTYPDASFDQIVYLGQVLCFISDAAGRQQAMREACRILRPGGTALFSFLSLRDRLRGLPYRVYLGYLRLLRAITLRRHTIQQIPWLKLEGRFNIGALLDREPYIYWYREREAHDELAAAGFTITGIGSEADIQAGRLQTDITQIERSPFHGLLYFTCRKG